MILALELAGTVTGETSSKLAFSMSRIVLAVFSRLKSDSSGAYPALSQIALSSVGVILDTFSGSMPTESIFITPSLIKVRISFAAAMSENFALTKSPFESSQASVYLPKGADQLCIEPPMKLSDKNVFKQS